MSKSQVPFTRWGNRDVRTWPYQVFQKYSLELERMLESHFATSKFLYTNLHNTGATWADNVQQHFRFNSPRRSGLYSDLKDFSNAFNEFVNWSNLNGLMTISSNLETYMATIISLAIESDPGVLLNCPKMIDGAIALKYKHHKKDVYEQHIINCTKGDWSSRSQAYKKLFGIIPSTIEKNIKQLEHIRNIRNNIGHSLGRDIKKSRKHGNLSCLPISKLSAEQLNKHKKLLWEIAKEIDTHLLNNHIGEYQVIHFYHENYPQLSQEQNLTLRANQLKKMIGQFGASSTGKKFCKELVLYYENL